MPLTIANNISSLKAQRRLSENTNQLSKTFERLSSGLRINKASDDAAGLSIAESLKSDRRVFNQGVRNLNDGISLLNIADSAIESLSNITVRLKELAEQSANGTYSVTQRKALDKEAQALSKEYSRIVQSTQFNGVYLLNGSLGIGVRLQGGYGLDGSILSGVGGAIGTGSFLGAVSYLAESDSSTGVTLGDLNGDGFLDLVTVGIDGGNNGYLTIRLGTGSGSFGLASTYAAETGGSNALSLADLNGDGILDIVTAGQSNTNNGYATVRLGTGNGSFGSATSFTTDTLVSNTLSLSDLNGDGILDLITAGQDSGGFGTATIRLGSGNGSFGSAISYMTEARETRGLSIADINGDGILDLVTAGRDYAANGIATVRLGTGSGSFSASSSYVNEAGISYSVSLGDLNGDGILDLVTAGQGGAIGRATIRLGTGSGSFGSAVSYVAENSITFALNLGDVNGDGILDLVTAGQSTGPPLGYATIRLGNGNGSFGSATSYASEYFYSNSLKLGDLNGDGVLDLVTAGYGSSNGYSTVRLSNTKDGSSPLLGFDLSTLAGAKQALSVFDQKIQQLSKQRGQIGAFQSRVSVATNVLQATSENYSIAESRIRDADIAEETSKLLRLQILQQSSSSVLAQANLQPQLVLKLLEKEN